MGAKPSSNVAAELGAILVPGWAGQRVAARSLAGTSNRVFGLSVHGQPECFVLRILDEDEVESRRLVAVTRLLDEASITPALIACNGKAIVQCLIKGQSPSRDEFKDNAAVEELAKFVAALHRIPLEEDIQEAPKARAQDLLPLAQRPGGEQLIEDEITALGQDLPLRTDPLVFTHGDLRFGNIIKDTDGRLWAVDLEMAGPRPRATDIAHLFFHWGFINKKQGYCGYPSCEVRTIFARTYLQECGLPNDAEMVEELLWNVEWNWPFQATFHALSLKSRAGDVIASPPFSLVPHARRALKTALQDAGARYSIVECGIAALAASDAAMVKFRKTHTSQNPSEIVLHSSR